jgi:hypothetical protein
VAHKLGKGVPHPSCIVARQINLIVSSVKRKSDGFVSAATINVVDQNNLDLLGHGISHFCIGPDLGTSQFKCHPMG